MTSKTHPKTTRITYHTDRLALAGVRRRLRELKVVELLCVVRVGRCWTHKLRRIASHGLTTATWGIHHWILTHWTTATTTFFIRSRGAFVC